MKKKKKSNKQKFIIQVVKIARKQSREEEIKIYGKPLNFNKVIPSKKTYNRQRNKKENKNDLFS